MLTIEGALPNENTRWMTKFRSLMKTNKTGMVETGFNVAQIT
jgi:hypothetical protein